MYCHTHCCWYTQHCPSCCHGHWHAPAPMHWCGVCNRYTHTWHHHQAVIPQPIHGSHYFDRDRVTINALAGGPRRSA